MLRIALVVPEDLPVPPNRGGSVQIYLHELAKGLQSRMDVTVISQPTKYGHEIAGIKYAHMNRHLSYAEYIGQVGRVLRRRNFDVIQVDNRPKYVSLVAEACPNVPVVLNLHSMNFLAPAHISYARAKQALRSTTAINTVSMAVRDRLLRRFPFATDKSSCIYAGVNSVLFPSRFTSKGSERRIALRRSMEIDQTPILLYTGRLVPRKGIDHLINAVRLLTTQEFKVQLWIIGGKASGRRTEYDQQLRARSHGLPVRFFGFIPPTQLADYYLAADVLVCPSAKPEGLPLVVLEGACSGLPVVASRHSGIQECVREGETGLLVSEYKDPSALAEAIVTLLRNPKIVETYGKQAAEWVNGTFTWDTTAAGFAQLYECVASGTWGKEMAASLRPCR